MESIMSQNSAPPRFGVIAILSAVVIVFLIIGLALVGLLVQPEEPVETTVLYQDPMAAVNPATVDPALAVAQLGGLASEDVIDQAVSQARPGTAMTTILFSPQLGARELGGDLLLLGTSFAERGDVPRAVLAYQMAADLATLSPDLSDTTRADIFLQAGNGLIGLDQPVQAKIYLDQARLVATESNYLQAAYRSAVLSRLSESYRSLGLRGEAREALELSAAPASLSALPEQPLVLPRSEALLLPMEIQDAEAERWRAAQAVVEDLVLRGGEADLADLEALRQALLQEDGLKSAFFADRLATTPQLSTQADILQAQIAWLSLKYRVAIGGFGLSLVPEWEAEQDAIRAALRAGYDERFRIYSDIIVALPDVNDIDRATEESLRRQTLAGVLGRYPDFVAEEWRALLLQATGRLIETQPNTQLRVSYLDVDSQSYYVLISDREVLNP